MVYRIWEVKNYSVDKEEFKNLIEKKSIDYDDIDEICEDLEDDNSYHFRIFNNNRYIFFGDIDGYKKNIDEYMNVLFEFLKKRYNLDKEKYYYTQNSKDGNSYHFSIPSWNTTTEKLKEIFAKFKEENKNNSDFVYTENNKKKNVIDTSIYSDHWFRCPNQSKGDNSKGTHKIIKGDMKNFVIEYIPKKSKSIDEYQYIEDKKEENKKNDNEKILKTLVKKEKIIKKDNDEVKSEKDKNIILKKIEILKKFITFYTDEYYDDYNFWYKIGMGLKKLGTKYNYNFKDDFREFSRKSLKYNDADFEKYWCGFDVNKITINEGTLYKYARDCNIGEYKNIMKELYQLQKIEITEKYIVETLKEIAGDYFIYVKDELYCFNIRNKLWYIGDNLLKKYINDELYDYLFNLITDSITDEITYKNQLRELKNYCLKVKGQELLAKAYEIRNKNETHEIIAFDENKYLFGFTNGVYDLQKNEFRKYNYDDYITINTGYDYEEGSDEDKKELEDMLKKIMPDKDKRYLLLQILCTGLIGKAYQNYFIFNGSGGNGKSSLTKLMKIVLGDYYYKLDSKYLLELPKQGASPELAKISHKRYVISSEPPASKKIKNSIYKQLTGDSEINARFCNSNKTDVIVYATFVLECNKRPLLEEEPTDADARRIIDLLFSSKFTLNEDEVDEKNNIFLADKKYEDNEYLKKVKNSFFEILAEYAHRFLTEEKECFKVPNSVKERSQEYINSSYQYLQFLNDVSVKTNNKLDFITLSDLLQHVKSSDLYINSSKEEKRKITLKSMVEFFSANKSTVTNFKEIHRPYIDGVQKGFSNVLIGYKFNDNKMNNKEKDLDDIFGK
jgi:phage/plasmid-associated DNA primase